MLALLKRCRRRRKKHLMRGMSVTKERRSETEHLCQLSNTVVRTSLVPLARDPCLLSSRQEACTASGTRIIVAEDAAAEHTRTFTTEIVLPRNPKGPCPLRTHRKLTSFIDRFQSDL